MFSFENLIDSCILTKMSDTGTDSDCTICVTNNGDANVDNNFDLSNISVSSEQIIQIIEGLKSKRSSGYDGLFSILLKQIKCEISPYLTLLLNQCLTTSIFPEKLKIAKIIPI